MSTPEASFIVKVCGVTLEQDIAASIHAGANAIGFNFFVKSKRYIAPQQARRLTTPAGCVRVGVFVNANREDLLRTVEEAQLDVVQLHGRVAPMPNGLRIWRSLPAGSVNPEEDLRIETYLLDTPTPEHGGSGQTFDWSVARDFPYRFIVAGGLDADNVASAIEALRPCGVDACSRLESAPGKKDAARVRAFVQNALRASEQLLKQEVSL